MNSLVELTKLRLQDMMHNGCYTRCCTVKANAHLAVNVMRISSGMLSQDVGWGDYMNVVVKGIVQKHSVGPLCFECVDLKKGWPLIPTVEVFIEKYKTDKPHRDLVDAARLVLRANHGDFDLPGLVHAARSCGQRMEVSFFAYTYREFMLEFEVSPESLDMHPVQFCNEDGDMDNFYLVRDESAPRKVTFFSQNTSDVTANMMKLQVRPNQQDDIYQMLLNSSIDLRHTSVKKCLDRMKIPSYSTLKDKAGMLEAERERNAQESHAQTLVGDIGGSGSAPLSARGPIGAIALPAWMQKPVPPAASKAKSGGKGGASKALAAGSGGARKSGSASVVSVGAVSKRPRTSKASDVGNSSASLVNVESASTVGTPPGKCFSGAKSVVAASDFDVEDKDRLNIQHLLIGIKDKRAVNGV
jgi:hypothetical protein